MRNLKYIISHWILGLGMLSGQSVFPEAVLEYPFIRYELNRILEGPDSSSMDAFYDKLDALMFSGHGKISIVHMGGSHVQADVISGRIRERLQTFYPGNKGSRGLLFPYKVARTNNPYNYYVSYSGDWDYAKNVQRSPSVELGLTGMAVTTRDSAATILIRLASESAPANDFNFIRLFEGRDTNLFSVRLPELDSTEETYRIFRKPGSGYTEIFLENYHGEVLLEWYPKDSSQTHYELLGIQLENEDPGITYHSIGVNGAGTYSYLGCAYLQEDLAQLQPDLVIFGIGINDAAARGFDPSAFEYRYKRLFAKVRAVNPNACILLLTNNDSYRRSRRRYYVNPNGEVVRQSMLKLSREEGVAVWDLFSIMGGLESMKLWENEGLAKRDKIHFTFKGYRLTGDLLFAALLEGYKAHLKQQWKQ